MSYFVETVVFTVVVVCIYSGICTLLAGIGLLEFPNWNVLIPFTLGVVSGRIFIDAGKYFYKRHKH